MLPWIIGGILGVVFLITIIFLIGLFVMGWRKRPTTPSRPSETGDQAPRGMFGTVKQWWEENVFFLILAFILFHYALFITFPEWWTKYIKEDWRMWGLQGVMLFFVLMIPTGKKVIHPLVGKWGSIIMAVFIAIVLIDHAVGNASAKNPPPVVNSANSNKPSALLSPPPVIPPSDTDTTITCKEETPDKKVTEEMLAEEHLSDLDNKLMMKHGCDESGYHQMDPKDPTKVFLHKNTNGTFDHGEFQINDLWFPVLKKMGPDYDPDGDIRSNVRAALYVLRHQGHTAWRRGKNGDILDAYRPVLIMASVAPKLSEPKLIPIGSHFTWTPAETVKFCINAKCAPNEMIEAGPDTKVHLGDVVVTIQFQSEGSDETPIIFAFK